MTAQRRFAALIPCALLVACTTTGEAPIGTCTVDPGITATCNATGDGGAPSNLGLTGYTCNGTARPDDEQASYAEGQPQGTICANQLPPNADGTQPNPQNYCCTSPTQPTTCAYNPTAACDPGTYDYECQNINRPESYNPKIKCGQGVRSTELVDYCCSGTGLPPGCSEFDGLSQCVPGLVGWTCPIVGTQHILPKGQDLLSNKSRADQYFLLCSVPQVAPSGKVDDFCCYPPSLSPPGGSCAEDIYVPGCNALTGFGFSCYGTDKPSDDFPPIVCSNPGTPGVSMDGYPSTQYCCSFINAGE